MLDLSVTNLSGVAREDRTSLWGSASEGDARLGGSGSYLSYVRSRGAMIADKNGIDVDLLEVGYILP
jgi:hypothetical protein